MPSQKDMHDCTCMCKHEKLRDEIFMKRKFCQLPTGICFKFAKLNSREKLKNWI